LFHDTPTTQFDDCCACAAGPGTALNNKLAPATAGNSVAFRDDNHRDNPPV
jgi:hypothetical protein